MQTDVSSEKLWDWEIGDERGTAQTERIDPSRNEKPISNRRGQSVMGGDARPAGGRSWWRSGCLFVDVSEEKELGSLNILYREQWSLRLFPWLSTLVRTAIVYVDHAMDH